ncbi:hypothetical protein BKA93DRAFT_815883 [Sparassis latifolia]
MSHHINPRSVNNYLSGICSELEPFFPAVRTIRASMLVQRTIKGCLHLYDHAVVRKCALTYSDLNLIHNALTESHLLDDELFLTQLLTGFHMLMCLGELVWPDNTQLRDPRSLAQRHLVQFDEFSYSFLLPTSKNDCLYEGSRILVKHCMHVADPWSSFTIYLHARDRLFPWHPHLWLHSNGKLRSFFPTDIAGHSMRSGGATSLAECGISPTVI